MADLTVTAANVVEVEDVKKAVGLAGETITAGQPLYEKVDSDTIKRMYRCINSGEAEAKIKGVSLHAALLNQPIVYAREGTIKPGAAVTSGMAYFVSNAAGGICPAADIATAGEMISLVGFAPNTTDMILVPKPTGQAVD